MYIYITQEAVPRIFLVKGTVENRKALLKSLDIDSNQEWFIGVADLVTLKNNTTVLIELSGG